ncbi:hypothetical protein LYSHEL_16160 [Lysobacter helvus]|uniref:BON domain-containing protein n=2 Tax=Lysobacteraceae TaxID=32033 RepID=A0ABN6FSC4_9GAMM|nr:MULTISPECIES: BON domain-containing protein [Lysobacter]BCT92592.1 hypothetical protein LYSCAS_16160 [Lysobacter caseinilyticus]BCT95745.1 hypothetical protein LYSHEL_16160 [Lysobacter helvus]
MKHREPWGRGERERGEGQRGEGLRGAQNPDTWNSEPQWLRNEREQRAGPDADRQAQRGGPARYDDAYRTDERGRAPYAGARDERDERELRRRAGTWEEHSRGYEASGWDDDLDLGGGQRYQPFHVGTGMGLGTGSPGYGYGSRGGWDLGTHQRDIGRSFRGMGPQDYTRPDERIREDIHERLTQSHDIDARKIQVDVNAGNVTLTGTVIERRMRYLAEDLVEGVTGVANIDNQLQVQNGLASRPDDPH